MRAFEARMTISSVAIVACICLLAFLLSYRVPVEKPGALTRLALLHGVHPLWGESAESVRNRTTAASRWPYSRPAPQFVWWARAWHGVVRSLHHR
jgi:hypothetical protein